MSNQIDQNRSTPYYALTGMNKYTAAAGVSILANGGSPFSGTITPVLSFSEGAPVTISGTALIFNQSGVFTINATLLVQPPAPVSPNPVSYAIQMRQTSGLDSVNRNAITLVNRVVAYAGLIATPPTGSPNYVTECLTFVGYFNLGDGITFTCTNYSGVTGGITFGDTAQTQIYISQAM